jgi:rSAM-associated Gly-rich repeat protein
MAEDRRSFRALAALLPAGAFGLSVSLASADAAATQSEGSEPKARTPGSVADRLESIREDVARAIVESENKGERHLTWDPETQLAWWGNGGWRNGGWHNWGNGWHNGGWHNWGNGGWGNGGWHNWGNGLFPWGNGWHNW